MLKGAATSGGSGSGGDFYPTTMSTGNTGAQNATALVTDITAADGQQIFVPKGEYTLAATVVSSIDVNIWFEPGAILIPAASLYLSGVMVLTTNGAITLNNLTVQGNDNGAPVMWRSNTPTFFYAHNTYMYNVGTRALNTPTTTGVYGFLVKGATGPVIIDGWRGVEFNDSNDSGTTLSFVRQILLYNNKFCHVTNAYCEPGSAGTHQVDFIQCLDDLATHTQQVVIDNSEFIYNENVRRCVKQTGGGLVKLDKCYITKSASFIPVSGSTNIGTYNLNCLDYSSNTLGKFEITNCYIDGTGFQTTIANTGGALSQVTVDNCDIIGGILNVIRNNPDTGAPQNQPPVGMYIVANDVGSGISNSRFYSGVGCIYQAGSYNYIRDCLFDDPRDYVFDTGNTGVKGFECTGNSVITRTAGYLSAVGYVGRIQNVLNIRVFNNTLYESGNTTEATTFISISSASATGYSGINIAPAGITALAVGSSAVVNNALAGTTVTGIMYLNGGTAEVAVYAGGNTGTSKAINGDNGNLQAFTCTGALTFTYTTPTHPCKFTVIVTMDGSGHVYAMPAATKWIGGTPPTYSTAAGKIDIFSIIWDGTNYYGVGGIAFA